PRGLSGPGQGQPYPSMRSQSLTDKNLLPLTPRQLAAFQDVFRLLSSSPAGTVDMCSMKAALRSVGIQLSPEEMWEAPRHSLSPGDGTVSFKDFLGVLTDNHRFAQCVARVRNSRIHDPQGLQTLLFEMLLKLLDQGSVPSKSVQEVMTYYSKKKALQLNPGWTGQSRGHARSPYAPAGLAFYCPAARSGFSSAQLARSLHRLHKAGARSPYSQIPNLALRTESERRTRTRAPRPEVRLPKPYQPRGPKRGACKRQLSLSPLLPPTGFVDQSLECMRHLKLPPSPPTLVQKQLSSPSPACLQRPAVKSLYK
uniref:EF-hand domain-containing protein n=1 Tax=Loxodonta africana TaxID=9785 RepID=G3UNK1_LOXAF